LRDPSSTSSFDSALAAGAVTRVPVATTTAWARSQEVLGLTIQRRVSRLPAGGLYALLFITLVHLLISHEVVPEPLAAQPLRARVLTLTRTVRPCLIVAGDSRAQVHVRPDVLATHFNLPTGATVNIGMPACGPSAVLAAYRELRDRFAPHPLMILSVSFYCVNDGVQDDLFIRDESVWSMNFAQRIGMLPLERALASVFLPERALLQALTNGRHVPGDRVVKEGGFVAKPAGGADGFSHQAVSEQLQGVAVGWFGTPQIDGFRWHRFVKDLQELRDLGVHVVLLDGPVHPSFWEGIADTPRYAAYKRFRAKLAALGQRLDMPVLEYDGEVLHGLDPDQAYFNLTHLSRTGATRLSEQIAADLRDLIDRGQITPPVENLAGNVSSPSTYSQ